MKQLDSYVVQQGLAWLESGRPVWLCTVLSTYGSAPRGPGAMLVALSSGDSKGSLSGGCIEEDFLHQLSMNAFEPRNQLVRYGEGGLTPARSLPCGGVLDVLVEYFAPTSGSVAHFSRLDAALSGGDPCLRRVILGDTHAQLEDASAQGAQVLIDGGTVLLRIGATQRLIIAGLSPVADYCARYALSLGFEVIICDPREEVTAGFAIDGVELRAVLPALFIAQGNCHSRTAVVALTHDPRLDDPTLMEAVRTRAFYIGAMGSTRTSTKRFERLKRIAGLQESDLGRISAPIGLNLGSKTPAEIAIAVMADILRVSNGIPRTAL